MNDENDELVESLASTLIEVGEQNAEMEKELAKIKIQFKSFFKAVLKNLPKNASAQIFKDYQKASFQSETD